jgi:Fic family protein
MGRLERHFWATNVDGLGLPRRDRRSGAYEAYVPDRLVGRPFMLTGEVAADVADASNAITRLDAAATTLTNTESLARLLLRAESVASSQIEGLTVSAQRLLRADVARAEGLNVRDETASEVLANVDAMSYAVHEVTGPITVDQILEVHRRLLAQTDRARYAGVIRTAQNWIGRSNYNPIGADYVPPPPGEVAGFLEDLATFCNEDALPAVAQAAIAHAQFETIHPFVDGNGRTGRALIYMVLRRRGLAIRTTPPVSLVLATRAQDYVRGLNASRYVGSPSSPEATEALNDWIGFFAAACTRAVADAESFEKQVETLQAQWRARLGHVRSDSSVFAVLRHLPEMPVFTVNGAVGIVGRTFNSVSRAVETLVEANIVTPAKAGSRNRVFEARELINAFTDLERQLASPEANTRISAPTRPVPFRPRHSVPDPNI